MKQPEPQNRIEPLKASIRELMKEAGVKAIALASRASLPRDAVRDIMRDREPNAFTVVALARYAQCSVEDLNGGRYRSKLNSSNENLKSQDIHRTVRHMETTSKDDGTTNTEVELTPTQKQLLAAYNNLSPETQEFELMRLQSIAFKQTLNKDDPNFGEGQIS